MYGVDIWRVEKRLIKSMRECAKKILEIPRFAANGVAELGVGKR
jgi:hypothetical protein